MGRGGSSMGPIVTSTLGVYSAFTSNRLSLVISGPPCVGSTSVRALRGRIQLRPELTLSNNRSNYSFCHRVIDH